MHRAWTRTAPGRRDDALSRELEARLAAVGFFDPPGPRYTLEGLFWALLFAAAFTLLCVPVAPPLRLVCLVALGVTMLEFGIIAHDCGHFAVSRRRWVNELLGYTGMSLVCGLSFSRWRVVHNQHHRHSQEQDRDPDMQFALALVVYEDDLARRSCRALRLARWQSWYFWPLTALYWVSLRWDGLAHMLRRPRRARIDCFVLPAHYLLWLALPSWLIGPGDALLNYVIAASIGAVLTAAVFVINHIGLPVIAPGRHPGHLRQQISLSRNISGGRWADLCLGGLNFHVEHHLYPSAGRAALRRASPVVKAFCAEHGIPYVVEPLGQALRSVTRRLAELGRAAGTELRRREQAVAEGGA